MTKVVVAGIGSGLVLGFFLKWVEANTGILVYTLLLNIDFIPIVNQITWGEPGEFLLHLVISLLLAAVLFHFAKHKGKLSYLIKLSFMLTFPTIFLYFPLSFLSVKDVPGLTDYLAFMYWTLGHILYSLSLALLAWLLTKKKSALHQ